MISLFHVKRSMFALFFSAFVALSTHASFDNWADGTRPGDVLWRVRLCMTDFTGKDAGWFDVRLEAYNDSVKLPDGRDVQCAYRAEILSDTELPFWLFTGKSKTKEVEYLDAKNVPVYSEMEIETPREKTRIYSWIDESNGKSKNRMRVRILEDRGRVKEKILEVGNHALTAANIPFYVRQSIVEGKPVECYMVNKAKPEVRKITFRVESFDGRPEALQYAGDSSNLVKLVVDLHMLGGKAVFYIDREANPFYGEGLGVKAVAMKSDID